MRPKEEPSGLEQAFWGVFCVGTPQFDLVGSCLSHWNAGNLFLTASLKSFKKFVES